MLTDMSKSCKYRLILSKIMNCQKLSDYLVFRCSLLINRQLPVLRLSANCLDGLLMKGIVKCEESSEVRNCQMKGMRAVSNSDCRNGMRWQNSENRNLCVTILAYWADA